MSEKLKKGLRAKNALIFLILTERSPGQYYEYVIQRVIWNFNFLFVLIFSNIVQRHRAGSTVLNQNMLKGVQKVMI